MRENFRLLEKSRERKEKKEKERSVQINFSKYFYVKEMNQKLLPIANPNSQISEFGRTDNPQTSREDHSESDRHLQKEPISDIIVSGYTSPNVSSTNQTVYRKLPAQQETFLAYVVAIRDPLNIHLDIYWSLETEKKYSEALNYNYMFVSEELNQTIHTRRAYSCHLRGVEIISEGGEEINNMKEAYILMSTHINSSNGWVLVTVSDIDIYQRILVNIFDIVDRQSLNKKLLSYRSVRPDRSGKIGNPIAKEYVRPYRKNAQVLFSPKIDRNFQDYHIVYNSGQYEEKSPRSTSHSRFFPATKDSGIINSRERFPRTSLEDRSWRK